MFLGIIRQTIMITSLVLIMMLIIEYFNVISRGKLNKSVYLSKFKQVFIAALLGLIPGCIGGFAAVSMFTHGILNFGALAANMIASLGDESFVIMSMMPYTAIILNISVLIIAIAVGLLINLFVKSTPTPLFSENHMVIHAHESEIKAFSLKNLKENLLKISFQRAIILIGLLLFIFGVFSGQFGHGAFYLGDMHELDDHHSHEHKGVGIEYFLFTGLALFTIFILLRVDEHFLEEHLWEHIIKKHFLRIFLWTFGALVVIGLVLKHLNIEPWLENNQITVLFIALLIGIIPESGPHLLFVTLYASGSVPFSILLANSIVQDGHSALPLLAESKRNFLYVKGINFAIGLIFGLAGYFMGW
jgi:hypothetical protein